MCLILIYLFKNNNKSNILRRKKIKILMEKYKINID